MSTIALVADPSLAHKECVGICLVAGSGVCLDLLVGEPNIIQISSIHAHGIGETRLKQPGIVAALDGDEHTQRRGKRHTPHPDHPSHMRGGCGFFLQRDSLLSSRLASPYEKFHERGQNEQAGHLNHARGHARHRAALGVHQKL